MTIESDSYGINIDANGAAEIRWGDDTVQKIHNQGDETKEVSHMYDSYGEYQISIHSSDKIRIYPTNFYNTEIVQSVDQWGDIKWDSMEDMFYGAKNMTLEADDTPNLEQVENMGGMFSNTKCFKGNNLEDWDTGNVEDMNYMFSDTDSFNGDISNWDVSNVENMNYMFADAKLFDQDISNWNVFNVKQMCGMFENAESFNQDISNWDVSNVEYMRYMFQDAESFNQDLTEWDISIECNTSSIFRRANAMEYENIPDIILVKKL